MIIDGIEIELTKKGNRIDVLDPEELSAFIDTTASRFANQMPINDLSKIISGVNVLRVLNTLFNEAAFRYWKDEVTNYKGTLGFKSLFKNCFGFTFSSLNKEAKMFENEYKAVILTRPENVAESTDFKVKYVSQNNNVATFEINDYQVDICLSGRKNMKNSKNILVALMSIRDGLTLCDDALFKMGINMFGRLASQRIIELFFENESRQYFVDIAFEDVRKNRERLTPVVLLKRYFGCTRTSFYCDLLDELERLIPTLNEYLVKSSIDVINSNNQKWILYENYASMI